MKPLFNSSNALTQQSTKWQRSSRNHACPICKRTKDADCSWVDGEVYFCHTYQDDKIKIPGFVCQGHKEIWGMFFPTEEKHQKDIRSKTQKGFIYPDLNRNPLVKVIRTDDGSGSKRFCQYHWDEKKWVKGLTEEAKQKLRLYRISDSINQDAIAQGKPLLIVEGEDKVDLLLEKGIAATCSIGGAGKWRKYGYPNYLEDLKGAKVVLCPDRDQPGINHCLDIEKDFPDARWLYAYPNSSAWSKLPKKGGLDIADWVKDYELDAEQILSAIGPKRVFDGELPLSDGESLEKDLGFVAPKDKRTSSELLFEIAEQGEYFHTADMMGYVDIGIDDARRTLSVKGREFKGWLRYQYFCLHRKGIGSEALNQVLGVLEAKACFEGEEREVNLRLARYQDKVYLDLGAALLR